MTSASDEKWLPFQLFFQSGRAKDLSAPCKEPVKHKYALCAEYADSFEMLSLGSM